MHCIKNRTSLGQPEFTQRFLLLTVYYLFHYLYISAYPLGLLRGALAVSWPISTNLKPLNVYLISVPAFVTSQLQLFCSFKYKEKIKLLDSNLVAWTISTEACGLYSVQVKHFASVKPVFFRWHFCLNGSETFLMLYNHFQSLILSPSRHTWVKKGQLLRTLLKVIVLNIIGM